MTDDRKYPKYQSVDGFTIPDCFSADIFRDALKYEPQDDDVFIATFPKNGTTWTQMLTYLIYRDGRPPGKITEVLGTSPFLEMLGRENIYNRVKPGTIKVHLPYHLTPRSEKAKYIFVVRNPKDTVVSFFHHTRLPGYCFENGDFDTYFEIFMNGKNDFGDYFDWVLSWYEHRHDSNVLLVYYEDMKKDIRKEIPRLANFIDPEIGRKLESNPDILERIVENSSMAVMKKLNERMTDPLTYFGGKDEDLSKLSIPKGLVHLVEYTRDHPYELSEKQRDEENRQFIRKGIVGDWRNTFSENQNRRMDERIEQRLKGTEMYHIWKNGGYL